MSGDISRKHFLLGTAAVGAAGVLGSTPAAAADGPRGCRGGLRYRGVVYTVADGGTPETSYQPGRMRADMAAIAHRLHANSVVVEGDGVARLTATATAAADQGLHVWLRPTLGDRPAAEILEHLAETGRAAERLRRQGAAVHLSVGCEFVLYVPGIVPGDNALERVHNLQSGHVDLAAMQRKLAAFIGRAAAVGRSVFHGGLTYSAAQDDTVDWSLFDIVGIDYYSFFRRSADYVRELRRYQRWAKPLAIMEFGTCTYRDAARIGGGGLGWDVVDYDQQPPRVKDGLVRSERDQAQYLTQLLAVFESMNLYSASAFTFVDPDAPHRREPRYDLDMASYSLVKAIWASTDRPGGWHWEPKEAFCALAERYRRAGRADFPWR